ncbi:hypothetical protein M9H77_29603 [Catharanthus roseus]|uniref:Uncharacterized protein n=1 Tax=Catharanthus roseus TaxID=4058 RepID=A0ACB9ZVU1_CATRO|nr:hypothetical protein M9H77_29603 [Catharanthus roseus]
MLLDKVVVKRITNYFGYFELPMPVVVALPLPVGAEEQKDRGNRNIPRTVFLALSSAIGGDGKGVQDRFKLDFFALIQDFDLRLGCLELKREEQSSATNWG